MRVFAMLRRAPVAGFVAALACAAYVGSSALPASTRAGQIATRLDAAISPTSALTPADLTSQEQQLLAKVKRLSAEVTAAEKRYSAALDGVATAVTTAISDDRDHGALAALVSASQARFQQQIVQLYASAGPFQADASLLTSSIDSYQQGTHAISDAINQTLATAKAQRQAAAAAEVAVTAASHKATKKIAVEASVAAAANRVQSLLDEQKSALAVLQKELQAQKLAAEQAALALETSDFSSDTEAGVASAQILPPSSTYLALYQAAAKTCPNLPWSVLAAIGQVESGHGRNDGPSSAGAEGPMQFEPATFASYAVDADHTQPLSIDDPADAIFTAAHYLCANGAGYSAHGLANAIFHYNHAQWYVDLVLNLASEYAAAYPS